MYKYLCQRDALCYSYILHGKGITLLQTVGHVHCWEILAAEAFAKCLHIAGVLEMPQRDTADRGTGGAVHTACC